MSLLRARGLVAGRAIEEARAGATVVAFARWLADAKWTEPERAELASLVAFLEETDMAVVVSQAQKPVQPKEVQLEELQRSLHGTSEPEH